MVMGSVPAIADSFFQEPSILFGSLSILNENENKCSKISKLYRLGSLNDPTYGDNSPERGQFPG